jgi:hypothetical protein
VKNALVGISKIRLAIENAAIVVIIIVPYPRNPSPKEK